jgi:peptidoglycan L-alanyl-D-glutamate endopeptidase CwlK
MNHFSDASKERLKTCHRDLQTLFAHVIQEKDCTIVCGHRDKPEQDKAFAEGKSKLQYPQSKHNKIPSWAVDAAPYIKGKINWSREQLLFFAGYVQGVADRLYITGVMSHRLRIGADFDGNGDISDDNFRDEPHFELIPNDRDLNLTK